MKMVSIFNNQNEDEMSILIPVHSGVRHVLKSLLAEFDILMEEAGFQSIEQINRSAIDSLPNVAHLPSI